MPSTPQNRPLTLHFPLPDLELVWVAPGTFQMGDDTSRYDSEKPAHRVHINKGFYISKFLVTQRLYETVMQRNPSAHQGTSHPVENVSWNDTKTFMTALSQLPAIQQFQQENKLTDFTFRLPSEAEWEYAARGAQHSQGYRYCGSDELKQVGWYEDNSGMETKPVGLLLPNELGLYDMSGHVYEWCEDDWHDTYQDAPRDGSPWVDAPDRAAIRVLRGGGYFFLSVNCRPADRGHFHPDDRNGSVGFRLVFAPSQ